MTSSLRVVERTRKALLSSRRQRQSTTSSKQHSIKGRLGHALRPKRWLSSASTCERNDDDDISTFLKASRISSSSSSSTSKAKFRTFDEMLQRYQDTPVLVSFEAHWCGPCRIMKKELGQVSQEFGDSLQLFSIDTERWPKLGQRYQISGLPTVLMFHGSSVEPLHRIEGVEKAEDMIRKIREVM